MQAVRTLLVGYGEMGRKHHLPLLLASERVSVVGVVRAGGGGVAADVPVFNSLEDALGKLRPDLAVIATPHRFHYEQAIQCLEYGCHVLVEKPLALNFSEAEHVVRLAEEKGRLAVVGLQRRYEGFANVFRSLVAEDKLGELRLIHGLFAHRFSDADSPSWRRDPALAGAGIVDDSAFHLIDLLLYFAGGKARRLNARVLSNGEGPKALPHSYVCFFDTDSRVTVSACGSYISPVNSVQEEVSIWGSKGALFARRFCTEWNDAPPQVFFKSADGKDKCEYDLSILPRGRNLPLQLLLSVLTGQAPRNVLLTEAKDVLEAHRVIEEMRRQCA